MVQKSQKERRTLMLARPETTYGVDSIAAAFAASQNPYLTDAILCAELDIQVNPELLERDNYNNSLSKDVTGVGRFIANVTFRTELRASGVSGTAPRIGRLFKGAGMQETTIGTSAAATIANPTPEAINSSAAIAEIISELTKTTAPTNNFDRYKVTCTTPGAPATAKIMVTSAGFPEMDNTVLNSLVHKGVCSTYNGSLTVGGTAAAPTYTVAGTFVEDDIVEAFVGGIRFYHQVPSGGTATSAIATALAALIDADARMTATATGSVVTVGFAGAAAEITTSATTQVVDLGNSGGQVTIAAWTGSLLAGEGFEVMLRRPGVRYDPVSDDATSLSMWIFTDGSLYKVTGARGSWSISGQAAQYPSVSWTFMGYYNDPIDKALPSTVIYESSKPYKVELSRLAIYGMQSVTAKASRFTMDIANEVNPKDDINEREAFDEIQITNRTPVAGCDPEAVKPSQFSPWARMRREDTTRFHVAVGIAGGPGNIIRMQADRATYTGAPFANRNNIRAHDYQLRLARVSGVGDDELFLHFS